MISAVIFDIGGPLDLETAFEAAIDLDMQEGLKREGFVFDEAAWDSANRRAVETCAPSLYRSVIWQLTRGNLAASLRIYDWVQGRAAQREIFEPRPGIDGVLEGLKQRGLKLGLAANQPAAVMERLARFGLRHYFQNEGISAIYGLRKPDVRLFVRACEDLRVQPGDCIMVGDRIDNDVVPGKLLGMRTIRIRTGRHRDQRPRSWDETPDHEVDDTEGLQRALDALLEVS